MLHSGTKIGDYTLVEKLGSGGFGDVWKAEKRTALDVNYFALKFFRPREDGIDFEKIGREVAVWKQLRGLPHIISVIELDRFDDYVYVVSDFADGGSLESWLRNNGGKAPTHETAVRIALEILTGLEKLHEKGFVHRDLKPDNVLIMNGTHCLADFGISREIKTHSKATGTAGTMEYMPPEAFDKTPSVTPETDIWAVGVMLQRLLTGRLPYPQDDQPSLIAAILMSEPDAMPRDVPERLRRIVGKALRKKREERFASAAEMRTALADLKKNIVLKRKSLSTIIDEDFDRVRKVEAAQLVVDERLGREKRKQPKREHNDRVERELVEDEQLDRNAPETEAWNLVMHSSSIDALRKYLKEFPTGTNAGKVRIKLEKLTWSAAKISNDKTKLQAYLNEFPNDRNADSARLRLRELESTNPLPTPLNTSAVAQGMTPKGPTGLELVWIPPAEFMMGSRKENSIRRVTFKNGFWMGKYEVTQGWWHTIMGSNPSHFSSYGDNCPVENVSWDDAVNFIAKLNAKNDGFKYSLPTEAQWEYAARAGTTGDHYGPIDEISWYSKNSGDKTHPVGQKKPNAFGLYDMSGNVWEWVQDIYSKGYAGLPRDGSANLSIGDLDFRVLRGGSWNSFAFDTGSAVRGRSLKSHRGLHVGFGFRIVARPK